MKKLFLIIIALFALSNNLSASLGGLVDDIVDAPGDILYGDDYQRGYYDDGYRRDGWRGRRYYRRGNDYDNGYHGRGLFGRRYYRD